MKKFLVSMLIVLGLSAPTFALSEAPPRYVVIANTANTETVYLGVRGKQTLREYASTYVTVLCTEACVVTFDAVDDDAGFYSGSYGSAWGGASYDYYVSSGVPIEADVPKTIRVSAMSMTISGVTSSGTMTVVVEYAH